MPRSSASQRASPRSRTASECSDGLVDALTFGHQCFKNLFCIQTASPNSRFGKDKLYQQNSKSPSQKNSSCLLLRTIILKLYCKFQNEFTGEFGTRRADLQIVTNFLVAN